MTQRERLLTAWSFREPDRVPIELDITPKAYDYPEAERIVRFIQEEADRFISVPGCDWGFCGLPSEYHEERVEDVPGDYYKLRRCHETTVGSFYAVTKHNYDELLPLDFHWERRFIHTVEDMQRLTDARRGQIPIRSKDHREAVQRVGDRGVPKIGVLHPLGWLVRNSNMEEVYLWLIREPQLMHRFLERSNRQVADTVGRCHELGVGPVFSVTAHEMLIPPWMGMDHFEQFVFPYDKTVNDAVHAGGGRLRAHCHGNVMNYLERMSEMGVDAVEPLEPPPFGDVDLAQAKKKVGSRMLLSGNITSNNFLQMTPADVRAMVRDAVRAAAPGGGFTLRTTGGHASTNSAKSREQMVKMFENVEAYIDAGLEYGSYSQ